MNGFERVIPLLPFLSFAVFVMFWSISGLNAGVPITVTPSLLVSCALLLRLIVNMRAKKR